MGMSVANRPGAPDRRARHGRSLVVGRLLWEENMVNTDLINGFIQRTNGDRNAGIALLREFIFFTNTGRWPDHLLHRRWREFKGKGGVSVWSPR